MRARLAPSAARTAISLCRARTARMAFASSSTIVFTTSSADSVSR